MKPLRAGAALLTLVSAFALAQDAPKPKTVMTPKTVTTDKLAMTGMGGDAPAAKKTALSPKTVTTEKLTMTGAGKK